MAYRRYGRRRRSRFGGRRRRGRAGRRRYARPIVIGFRR